MSADYISRIEKIFRHSILVSRKKNKKKQIDNAHLFSVSHFIWKYLKSTLKITFSPSFSLSVLSFKSHAYTNIIRICKIQFNLNMCLISGLGPVRTYNLCSRFKFSYGKI